MVTSREEMREKASQQFQLRKLTKAGSSRYLSVGKILPTDWQAVKVYVERLDSGVCVLRLVQIK